MSRSINELNSNQVKILFYLVFAVSGFSGLIYESIWSHYLKLFLGHAAYAQTLVLVIFMGGMALGAWLVSKFTDRIYDLLRTYALIEIVIGVLGLFFHDVYVFVTDVTYNSVIPSLGSSGVIEITKWTLAALLILPQSVLLGSTFPLMSAGIIRKFPDSPGRNISMLYFSNSIGAVAGVLVSGFVLVELLGLPGTIQVAGFLNLLLAAVVLLMGKIHGEYEESESQPNFVKDKSTNPQLLILFLICASFTGLASFIYEIGWIRMLSLVLGSSTHAFELMLSAFISGLAIGGYWIRKHIDNLSDPIKFLGFIQLLMGALALSTLFLYNSTFDYMIAALKALDKTEQGYWVFNWFSHALAMLIMLPTTICAGMTLPVLTNVLLSKGYGERSIGMVYSFNTLGAIVGVIVAVQVLMPMAGLKFLVVTGSAVDMLLGLLLLWYVSKKRTLTYWKPLAAAIPLVFVIAVSTVQFDPHKMSSGVYRNGMYSAKSEILYHKDGKTATVDLIKLDSGTISIKTNGKPDASINFEEVTFDEPTMSLAVALPMDLKPSIENVAVIGFGSGLSTHVALTNPDIKSVDTIEIEPAMVEAAKGFGERVKNTYNDPRSHIYIEDAKTFFTSHNKVYDLIISEPSNPWVSGIASLFSKEFYTRIQRHLSEDGLFVQWLHMYEVDKPLMASVVKALGDQFNTYQIYFTTDADMLLIASNASSIPGLTGHVFNYPAMKEELNRVGVFSVHDLALHHLGDKNTIAPLFESYPVEMNSDYYPWVDLNAVRARYMKKDAFDLVDLVTFPLPLTAVLSKQAPYNGGLKYKAGIGYLPGEMAEEATYIFEQFSNPGSKAQDALAGSMLDVIDNIRSVKSIHYQCAGNELDTVWLPSFHFLMERTVPFLTAKHMDVIFQDIRSAKCYKQLSDATVDMIDLFQAVVKHEHKKILDISARYLNDDIITKSIKNDYMLKAAMLSNIALDIKPAARELWGRYEANKKEIDVVFRLLNAHAGIIGGDMLAVENETLSLN